MKNAIKIVGLCLILMLSVLSFCACESEYSKNLKRVFETDYFVCINYEGEDTVTILELTKLGREQEVLVIPNEINGFKVAPILGAQIRGGGFISSTKYLLSDAIKKIYIPVQMRRVALFLENATIITFSKQNEFAMNNHQIRCRKKAWLNNEGTNAVLDDENVGINCFFYQNSEIVWLDYISDGEVYYLPDGLKHKWYLEPECVTLWNGEYVIPDGQEKLNLYSK